MTYEDLLEQAYKKVKPVEAKERFEIPEIEGHIEGNKTIISNFRQIAGSFGSIYRVCDKSEHIEKFLEKELAAQGKSEGDRLILIRKIPIKKIQEKLEFYVGKYVICRECGKPDTEIIKQDNFFFIHCLACGAKHSIAKI